MHPTDFTLAGALAALNEGAISAEELTRAHVAAVEALNPKLNAFITTTSEKALDAARASDARRARGEAGPLEGIPLAIKDLFCTEGVRTTAGSKILGNFIPPYESTVTAQLKRDGAVFLGKANLDEFAMGSSNLTSAYGGVLNPWQRKNDPRAAGAGWVFGWLGCCCCGAHGAGGDGHGYGWFHPSAGGVLRHYRHQADLWALFALWHCGLCFFAGSGRPLCAHGGRLRHFVAVHGRA